jgi:hypothetical protein
MRISASFVLLLTSITRRSDTFIFRQKAKGEKNGVRGSPLNTRLDPLPGSPLHDGQFNTTKPLPPPTKKFIK